IQKTALGATQTVDWSYAESTLEVIRKLKENNVQIMSIEQAENSVSLNEFKPEKDTTYAFVFGNEVKGVQQEVVDVSDAVLEIPQ
ncbi:TrmH family RNA methyltransferase, partial [Aquimarina celericrescens]|nr:TrmH family RNA methyltransferase [Aquimarina celericrescens]